MRTRLLMVCLAAAGCGDDDFSHQMDLSASGDMAGDMAMVQQGLPTPDDYFAAVAIALCKNEAKCGVIGASEEAQCEADALAYAKGYPQPYSRGEATASKRLAYDPVAAQKCVDAQTAAGCTGDQYLHADEVCAGVFTPQVAPGGACQADGECKGGFCDRGAGSSAQGCAGTCTAWLAAGAACDPNNDLCDPTKAYCLDTTSTDGGPLDDGGNPVTTGTCNAFSAMGGPCDETTGSALCGSELFCVTTMGNTAGTCMGRGVAGDACTVFFFGDTNCQIDLYCDQSGASPVCALRKGVGAGCDVFEACNDGLDCIGLDPNTGAGTCGPFLDVGSTCDPMSTESGCPFGDTVCDGTSMKCRAIGGPSDDCTNTQYCRSGLYCDATNKCSPQTAFGAACTPPAGTDPDPCNAGACDPTTMKCTQSCM